MADTSVTYEGDGSTTTFSVPFPYINKTHVKVYVNSILRLMPSDYFWASTTSITFRNAPSDGSSIEIRRVTPGDVKLVNFTNGATLTEADLNLAFDQVFYLAQEAKENYADLINQEQLRIGTPNGIVSTDPEEWLSSAVDTLLAQSAADTLEQAIADIDSTGEVVLDIQTKLDGSIEVINLIGVLNDDESAFILDSSKVYIDTEGAGNTFAEKLDALEVADSNNSASITTLQTVSIPGVQADADAAAADASQALSDTGDLFARYGVSVTTNGYVQGFVINNGGPGDENSFVILADKFAVVDPSGDPGETEYVPFSISGGKINMTGDVEIDGNLLVTGSVDTGEIATNAVTEFTDGGYTGSVSLTPSAWTEVESVTVTTDAGDVVEINARLDVWFSAQATASVRIRRFDGATPVQILGTIDTKTLRSGTNFRWDNHYMWRFETPGAGTWTYKVEASMPTAGGTGFAGDCQIYAKRFKR